MNVTSVLIKWPLQVEISLQSSFQPGMKLEVANKGSLDTYWVATIITTCGQLLLLRYCGFGEDRKADFWCDIMTAELHPVGWCAQNNKTLQPPEGKATKTHSNTHIYSKSSYFFSHFTTNVLFVLIINSSGTKWFLKHNKTMQSCVKTHTPFCLNNHSIYVHSHALGAFAPEKNSGHFSFKYLVLDVFALQERLLKGLNLLLL